MRSSRWVQTKTQLEDDKPKNLGFQGWRLLMQKFSEDNKVECNLLKVDRSTQAIKKEFSTGATYEGAYDILGMAGYGTYTFSNGVIYEGDFEDGMFHGDGTLTFPSGIIIKGTWRKNNITERTLYFADGLRYRKEDWDYCKMPDRRFSIEYDLGLQPAAGSFRTAHHPTRDIPPEHYDTTDGFFDQKTKAVYDADDLTALVRCPLELEKKWIIDNCRAHSDVSLGPRNHLYEDWPEPELNCAEMKIKDDMVASSASNTWGFDGKNEDDGWRLEFSHSKARLSIVATRSVAEFGARQQKTHFQWGEAAMTD